MSEPRLEGAQCNIRLYIEREVYAHHQSSTIRVAEATGFLAKEI